VDDQHEEVEHIPWGELMAFPPDWASRAALTRPKWSRTGSGI